MMLQHVAAPLWILQGLDGTSSSLNSERFDSSQDGRREPFNVAFHPCVSSLQQLCPSSVQRQPAALGRAGLHRGRPLPRGRHAGPLRLRRPQQFVRVDQRALGPRLSAGGAPAADHRQLGVGRFADDVRGDAPGRHLEYDGAMVRGGHDVQVVVFPETLCHAFGSVHISCGESGPISCHSSSSGFPGCRPEEQTHVAARLDTQPVAGIATDGERCLRRSGKDKIPKARMKTLKMTIVIVSSFVICWTPYYILGIWYWFQPTMIEHTPEYVHHVLFVFGNLNTCCDPVIYGFYTASFRADLADVMACSRRNRNDSPRSVLAARNAGAAAGEMESDLSSNPHSANP
ncbi:gonadotropin releasing hormone receptor 1 isoform X2 [Festucalex cinctus]